MVATVAVALLLSAAPVLAQAPQTVGIQLVDAPANRADDPRARFYIVDHVPPGATIRRLIEVSNDTAQPQNVALYAAAADIGAGEFRFGDGRAANELTGWTTVTPPSVRLDAGAKGQATVTITVPADAASGERYAVAWAEVTAASSSGGGIGEASRVGVRIYLSVGPGGEPPTDFAITSVQPGRTADGVPTVTAVVRNTGGRAVDLSGSLSLRQGPAARTAGPFAAELGTTLGIGEAEPVLVRLNRALPAGPWDAAIVLRSGTTQRSANARITFPLPRATAGRLHTNAARSQKRRLAVVLGAAGVLAVLVTLVARRRMRRATTSDQPADQ
jgi:hypothetical protein